MGNEPQSQLPVRRKRVYVHKIQRKYALMMGLVLFFYTVLLFLVALLLPLVTAALRAQSGESSYAAREFIVLSETLWPAAIVGIVGSALMSVFVTHRIAGPLYRLERSADELANGNLGLRIFFRKDDELKPLAETLNEALGRIETALRTARDRGREVDQHMEEALTALQAETPAAAVAIERAEAARQAARALIEAVDGFTFSEEKS